MPESDDRYLDRIGHKSSFLDIWACGPRYHRAAPP
jgi:hypothetical protein